MSSGRLRNVLIFTGIAVVLVAGTAVATMLLVRDTGMPEAESGSGDELTSQENAMDQCVSKAWFFIEGVADGVLDDRAIIDEYGVDSDPFRVMDRLSAEYRTVRAMDGEVEARERYMPEVRRLCEQFTSQTQPSQQPLAEDLSADVAECVDEFWTHLLRAAGDLPGPQNSVVTRYGIDSAEVRFIETIHLDYMGERTRNGRAAAREMAWPRVVEFCGGTALPGLPGEAASAGDGPTQAVTLTISSQGLGVVEFGADVDSALHALENVLGEPDSDEGWGEAETCPEGVTQVRRVRWSSLEVAFFRTRQDSEGHLAGYTYSEMNGDDAAPSLQTAAGLELGATLQDLEEAYGGRLQTYEGPPGTTLFHITESGEPSGLGGILAGGEPGSRTVAAWFGGAECHVL